MCGQDGTAFVLRMRDAAYGDGVPTALSELPPEAFKDDLTAGGLGASFCTLLGFGPWASILGPAERARGSESAALRAFRRACAFSTFLSYL